MRRSRFAYWLQSPKGKLFMNYLYGIGALLILIGAIVKLIRPRNLDSLTYNLVIASGLFIEAFIFILDRFVKLIEDKDDDNSL